MAQSVSPARRSTTSNPHGSSPTHQRPRLRVVPKGYRKKAVRRRHTRRILAATSVSVCVIFFGVLALQVMLTQGQFKLQKLQKKISTEKTQFIELRAQVGQLESPTRIIDEAKTRLGMTDATSVHYLRPVRPILSQDTDQSGNSLNEWIALKQLQASVQ